MESAKGTGFCDELPRHAGFFNKNGIRSIGNEKNISLGVHCLQRSRHKPGEDARQFKMRALIMQLVDLLNMENPTEWIAENYSRFILLPAPTEVDTPEDIHIKGEDILCWDGCEWSIDYVEHSPENGTDYMANGTEVETYIPLPPKL